jgi:chorismate synthase
VLKGDHKTKEVMQLKRRRVGLSRFANQKQEAEESVCLSVNRGKVNGAALEKPKSATK